MVYEKLKLQLVVLQYYFGIDLLGGFYVALGRTAEAEQQFRHALQLDPKSDTAMLELAGMQVREPSRPSGADVSAGFRPSGQAVSADPCPLSVPIRKTRSGRHGIREAGQGRSFGPYREDGSGGHVSGAESGRRCRHSVDCRAEKNSVDVDALLQRSRIYLSSQKYAEAEAEVDLNQVLHFRKESEDEAHNLLSKVQLGRGKTAMEHQELGEALRLDPTYLAARVDLAKSLITTGGAQSALELISQAPKENQKVIALVVQRNWALLALGQVAEARKGVDELLTAGKIPDAPAPGCGSQDEPKGQLPLPGASERGP
jgi:Flp pilus assembly protein TadD